MKIKGKTVVDSTTPLALVINKTDVKAGKKKQPDACAAAVAAVRQCKGAISAHVHLSRVYVEFPDKVVRYSTPQALRTEIVSFDRGRRFEEGTYTLAVIPPHDRLETRRATGRGENNTIRESHKRHPEKEGWSRRPTHVLTGVRAHAPKKSDWK